METLFVGKNIIFLPEIDSTNSYAINLLKNVKLSEGTVVHTAHQTQGKGQRGSSWFAQPSSNLTASIILKPEFLALKNQFYLYMVAALACYDTTAELLGPGQFDIKIKWPNDILVNRKKIAGMLIENNLLNNTLNWSVVGVGLNVNQESFSGFSATSLKAESGQKFKVDSVLEILCKYFEKYYIALKNNKLDFLRTDYLSRLFGLDSALEFVIGGKLQTFYVKGVGATGLLVLQNESKKEIEVDVKEVTWII